MYKIGILIPTTSAKRDWNTFEDTTFFSVFLHSFTHTYCNEYEYVIYLVIDDDDKILRRGRRSIWRRNNRKNKNK